MKTRPPGPARVCLASRSRPACVRSPRFDPVAPVRSRSPHLPLRPPDSSEGRPTLSRAPFFPLCIPVIATRYPYVPSWPSRYVTAARQPSQKGIVLGTQSVIVGRTPRTGARTPLSPRRPALNGAIPPPTYHIRLAHERPFLPGEPPKEPEAACFSLSDATCCQVASLAVNWRHLTPPATRRHIRVFSVQ